MNPQASRLGYLLSCTFALVSLSSACALISKADVIHVRYFSPERLETAQKVASPERPLEVRLGRVSSSSNLRERIAYRTTTYELGYYHDYRWTERPEIYVRRALSRALYETHGFRRALDRRSPTLEVEVISFDRVQLEGSVAARVIVAAVLSDRQGVLFEKTMTYERPVLGDPSRIEDFVAAMALALDATAQGLAQNVGSALPLRESAAPADATRLVPDGK